MLSRTMTMAASLAQAASRFAARRALRRQRAADAAAFDGLGDHHLRDIGRVRTAPAGNAGADALAQSLLQLGRRPR